MATLLIFLHQLIVYAIRLYQIALVIYFLLSWIPNAYGTGLWEALTTICEPYVSFFRQILPPLGGVSFAGILALITLGIIRQGIDVIFQFLLQAIL